jgi:NADPH2:quinone reductase
LNDYQKIKMIPDQMKYIEISTPGGPEVLRIAETKLTKPEKGQVLIKVAAAGVNRLDILQRKGLYPPPPGITNIPGVEVAGEIVEVSSDCGDLSQGDQVCTLLSGGGYAEYVIADAPLCLPVPKGLNLIDAASLPEALFTVWTNIVDIANLKSGETFLVHGGSSGIGTMAIQLAKAFGANVITTAGSDIKCNYCKELGADIVINYKTQDFTKVCLAETNNIGINVILDMVGGDYLQKNIKISAEDGRIVIIAAMNGFKTEINLLQIMQKRIKLTGSTLRARNLNFKKLIASNLIESVWPLLETGKIRPVIYKTFPLSKAGSAHQLMESNEHTGKIVLDLN